MGGKFRLIVSERNTTQTLTRRERLKFWLYRKADYIVPNSYSQGDFVCKHFPQHKAKTVVIPNFVDLDKFACATERHRQQPAVILVVASIWASKNTKGFIDAVRQRRHTLYITMKAIIDWQLRFFQEGDEAELRPMILKDIAQQTGLDISTISRVSNVKYAQTRWGTFPLRYFFSDGYTNNEGEELSTRSIKVALRNIIKGEDKRHPLSDEALTAMLKEKGFPVARRTVAKYRVQLGLPIARLRRE